MELFFLIGPRCCGKTQTARMLEQRLACRVCDTDALICKNTGKTVAAIVADGGWEAFRAEEKAALAQAVSLLRSLGGDLGVIATGGGIVLDADNRERMRREGVPVYLAADVETLAHRLRAHPDDPARPALTSLPVAGEIAAVLRERDPLYRATARHVLDATLPPDEVVRHFLALLSASPMHRKEKI